jgi:uncharacterized protein
MPFVTSVWRDLLLLNYAIEPGALAPWVPPGVELADYDGTTLVSLVGLRYTDTKLLGLPIPSHRRFEAVNLCFYVRRNAAGTWRQGVVSVKELLPRWSLAWLARTAWGEPSTFCHMRSRVAGGNGRPRTVEYWWYPHERLNHLSATVMGPRRRPDEGSVEEFVLDHSWAYSKHGGLREYRLEHPARRVQPVTEPHLDCDAAKLYGEAFVDALAGPPHSALYAESSPVALYRPRKIG